MTIKTDNDLAITREDLFEGLGAATSKSLEESVNKLVAEMKQDDPDPTATALVAKMEQAKDNPVITRLEDGTWDVRSMADLRAEQEALEHQQALLGGIASGLDNSLGLNVPWGSIAVGGGLGLITAEIVDGLWPAEANAQGVMRPTGINMVIKAGLAVTATGFAKRWLGAKPAGFFAAVLILDLVSDFLPLDQWAHNVVDTLQRKQSGHLHQQQRMGAWQAAQAFGQNAPLISDVSQDRLQGAFS